MATFSCKNGNIFLPVHLQVDGVQGEKLGGDDLCIVAFLLIDIVGLWPGDFDELLAGERVRFGLRSPDKRFWMRSTALIFSSFSMKLPA